MSKDEGIFSDPKTIFDGPYSDTLRSVHTRAQERDRGMTISQPAAKPRKNKQRTVFVYDGNGQPKVAITDEADRITAFRDPTNEELAALPQARIVRQGFGDASEGMSTGKKVAVGLLVVGLVGGGIVGWRWYKNRGD